MSELIVDGQTVAAAIAGTPGVTARADSGTTTVKRPRVNFISGTNITVGVVDDGGDNEVEVTITGTGTSFPGFFGGTPAADSGGGGPGISGVVSRGDHTHPASSAYRPAAYRMRSSGSVVATAGTVSHAPVDGIAYTPRLAIAVGTVTGDPSASLHVSFATNTTDEGCHASVGGIEAVSTTTFIDNVIVFGSNRWGITTFSSVSVSATRIAGAGTYTGLVLVVGDD